MRGLRWKTDSRLTLISNLIRKVGWKHWLKSYTSSADRKWDGKCWLCLKLCKFWRREWDEKPVVCNFAILLGRIWLQKLVVSETVSLDTENGTGNVGCVWKWKFPHEEYDKKPVVWNFLGFDRENRMRKVRGVKTKFWQGEWDEYPVVWNIVWQES